MTPPPVPPGPDGTAGPHAFVRDMDLPVLEDRDWDHLRRSLRLRDGDPLTISDGAGSWRKCHFGARLVPAGEISFVDPPGHTLTIGFALTKGSKPELVVQKLTELGIDRIVPFAAEHSVARWDDSKADRQHYRLTRVAHEAAMQSRRVWLPAIAELQTFGHFAGSDAVRADRGGQPLSAVDHTVLVGPEGGWSNSERAHMDQVSLGALVLRAETAAIAAAALMINMRAAP